MWTTKEAKEIIGRVGYIALEGMRIKVRILDVRKRYGNTDYRIMPEGSEDTKWVLSDRVSVDFS